MPVGLIATPSGVRPGGEATCQSHSEKHPLEQVKEMHPFTRHPLSHVSCCLFLIGAWQHATASPADYINIPVHPPQALFVPEFDGGLVKLGSWQQSPTPNSPTPPQNWAKGVATGIPFEAHEIYSYTVTVPNQMQQWTDVIATNPAVLTTQGNGLFAPGDSAEMLVSVDGTVRTTGMWFASGTTSLYQLDSQAVIANGLHPTDGSPLTMGINVIRAQIETSTGTPAPAPVTQMPVVDLGVPIQSSSRVDINIEEGRLTLSANNSATSFRLNSWRSRTGTIVINTASPFGTAPVEIIRGMNFEAKETGASVPSRVLNNNISAPQRFTTNWGVDIISPSVIGINGAGNLTFHGNLTTVYNVSTSEPWGLGLTMSGSGTVTLNGTNDFGVPVTVNSGTLALGNNAALNGNGQLVLNGGAIQASGAARTVSPPSVKVRGNFAVTGLQDLTVNGPVDLDNATRTVTVSAPTVTIGGPISNGGLTKSGAGTMILSGLNTYDGGTSVSQGVLQLNNGGSVGSIRGTVGVTSGGTLRLAAANSLGTGAGTKVDTVNIVGGMLDNIADGDNGWGVAVNLNGATMRSNSGTNSPTTAKRYSMGGGASIGTIASATSSVISGRLDLREGNPDDRLTFSIANGTAADDLIVRAAITQTGGSYGIRKTGAGTMLLVSGANNSVGSGSTFTGGTIVDGGVLAVDGSQDGNRLSANHPVTVNNGGTFEIRGVNALPTAANAIDVTVNQGGTFRVVSGGSTFIGAATVASHAQIRNVTLNGGTVDLTYSGTLSAVDGESFAMNGTLTVGGTAPSVIQSSVTADRQGIALAGLRTFQVNDVTASSAVDLTVNAELESTTVTPGDDSLVKTGSGTLLLNRANSYQGQTVVDDGTLYVNGSVSGSTVVNGGVLGGTGSAQAVSINAAGILAPGNSIGTFSTQNVTFIGGTLALEINTSTLARDVLAVNGNLTIGAAPVSLTIADLGSNVALPNGTTLSLLTYTGSWDGNFFSWQGTPLFDDSTFTVGANLFRMDYGDAGNRSFSIVAIPEPAGVSVLMVAVASLSVLRSRRRR